METTPQPATAPGVDLAEARREEEYLRLRKAARRRQLFAIVALSLLGVGYLGMKVGSHFIAATWLEANHYRVTWGIDRENWMHGGVTTVRGSAQYWILSNEAVRADLKFLPWLLQVEELDLSTLKGLTDADLTWLDQLTELKSLVIDRSRSGTWVGEETGLLTDATLRRVGRLTRLRNLDLGGQRISDAGLAHLTNLSELENLDLRRTAITDEGLAKLRNLRRLKSLDLTGTRVTANGLREFEAARPGVIVEADPQLDPVLAKGTPKP